MPIGVIDVLRRFLPRLGAEEQPRDPARQRAVWAITHCRTEVLGGHVHGCLSCGMRHYVYHSCHHRSCPQCGRGATHEWVDRELGKRIGAPYFMVTFTLPSELRPLFFGQEAKRAFDLFFGASSAALRFGLSSRRGPGMTTTGFTGVLHTWNQRLLPHIHIHYLVPGGGLDASGRYIAVKNANFLVALPILQRRFRSLFAEALSTQEWDVDPAIWSKDWGVHIAPFGSGENAIKYLGAYIARTAIGDGRILGMSQTHVTFRWKDRSQASRIRTETITGEDFCRRYLRHVLPRGMRAVRYFGFCHPSAKKIRQRVAFLSGQTLRLGAASSREPKPESSTRLPTCPCCGEPMPRISVVKPSYQRGPPLAA
jgi:hypothetical protein